MSFPRKRESDHSAIQPQEGAHIMGDRIYSVYILASRKRGTLYVGMTSVLAYRVYQHKIEFYDGFTKRYGVKMLVYYEHHTDVWEAIYRERRIKKWMRVWKIALIEKHNPEWRILLMMMAKSSRYRLNRWTPAYNTRA